MKSYADLSTLAMGILAIAFAVVTLVLNGENETLRHKYDVMQACSRARAVQNESQPLEQRCAELQDKYNIEFVCDALDAYAYCQTEVK